MIQTKLGLNLTLKYLLTNFTRLRIALTPILYRVEILQEETKHMKIYFGIFPGQIEFVNILFNGYKLINKSCQIYQPRPLCIVCNIFGDIDGILLQFKLEYKLDISIFLTIYGR